VHTCTINVNSKKSFFLTISKIYLKSTDDTVQILPIILSTGRFGNQTFYTRLEALFVEARKGESRMRHGHGI
jgi:hypothetical protein